MTLPAIRMGTVSAIRSSEQIWPERKLELSLSKEACRGYPHPRHRLEPTCEEKAVPSGAAVQEISVKGTVPFLAMEPPSDGRAWSFRFDLPLEGIMHR